MEPNFYCGELRDEDWLLGCGRLLMNMRSPKVSSSLGGEDYIYLGEACCLCSDMTRQSSCESF